MFTNLLHGLPHAYRPSIITKEIAMTRVLPRNKGREPCLSWTLFESDEQGSDDEAYLVQTPRTASSYASTPGEVQVQLLPQGLQQDVGNLISIVNGCWAALNTKDLRALALALTRQHNLRIQICTGLGSSNKTDCMKKLRHTFLLCMLEAHDQEIIIDPFFRDQFNLGRQDPEFESFLLHEVPEMFVGTAPVLIVWLHTISNMIAKALTRLGLPRPPWREFGALQSKWAPSNRTEVDYMDLLTQQPDDTSQLDSAADRLQHSGQPFQQIIKQRSFSSAAAMAAPTPQKVIVGFKAASPSWPEPATAGAAKPQGRLPWPQATSHSYLDSTFPSPQRSLQGPASRISADKHPSACGLPAVTSTASKSTANDKALDRLLPSIWKVKLCN